MNTDSDVIDFRVAGDGDVLVLMEDKGFLDTQPIQISLKKRESSSIEISQNNQKKARAIVATEIIDALKKAKKVIIAVQSGRGFQYYDNIQVRTM